MNAHLAHDASKKAGEKSEKSMVSKWSGDVVIHSRMIPDKGLARSRFNGEVEVTSLASIRSGSCGNAVAERT